MHLKKRRLGYQKKYSKTGLVIADLLQTLGEAEKVDQNEWSGEWERASLK
nr:hypothetical protein [uncultured Cohaesibacter sp.]